MVEIRIECTLETRVLVRKEDIRHGYYKGGLRVFFGALIHGVPATANLHNAFTSSGNAYSIPTRGPINMLSGFGPSNSSKPPASQIHFPFQKSISLLYPFLNFTLRTWDCKLTRCIKGMIGPFCCKTQCLTNLGFGRTITLINFDDNICTDI